MTTSSSEAGINTALARSAFYKRLAKSFLYPTKEVYDYLRDLTYREGLSKYLTLTEGSPELEESIQALSRLLASEDDQLSRDSLEHEYNRLFAHLGSAKCPPYETEYGFENVFQKTEAMADIAGFYRAYNLEVSDSNTDRVDFIATELEFLGFLAANEAYAREHNVQEQLEICIDAQQKFLKDHLGRWVTVFVKILVNSSTHQFYLPLGRLAEQFLRLEFRHLGVSPSEVTAPNKWVEKPPEAYSCDVRQVRLPIPPPSP